MKIASIVRVDLVNDKTGHHSHIDWEWILTLNGSCDVVIEDTYYPCRKGTVISIPPEIVHYNANNNNATHIGIRIRNFISPVGNRVSVFQDDSAGTFASIAEIAFRQFYQNNTTEVTNALCQALYAMFFHTDSVSIENIEIEKAIHLFDASFTNPEFSAADIISQSYYSEAHFRMLFKKETGMTPVEYLTKLRINYAKNLLSTKAFPHASLSEIALYSGFYDSRYFSRIFKKNYGCSPAKFRTYFKHQDTL